ncbi:MULTISPECIES: flagellar export chaperone FlgN [unclassified Agarivorans]|uniref:flagellar export chaperone FlgN n=1 Tax=unclassified Agarivorans TaxID=2636026 RepID=UPI003D7D1D43
MIVALLNTQEQQLNLLLSLLEQEKHALAGDDTIALYAIASQKEQALTAITQADHDLESSEQTQQLIDVPELAEQVERIQQLLKQCQELNTINGEIIQASNEKVRQLSAVIDQLQNQNATTYDKLGKKHSSQRMGKGFKA